MSELLCEVLTWNQANVISEEITDGDSKSKDLYLTGVFIQGEQENANGRFYPITEIKSACDQINELMNNGETIYGEADHPDKLQINLDRVSHIVTELRLDGNNGVGKLKILPTPMGNICRTLIQCGGKLGVSSRGSGDVGYGGKVKGFEIVTIDIVARPSANAAYPTPVYESLFGNRTLISPIKSRELQKLSEAVRHDRSAQKYLKNEILSVMDLIFKGKTF